MLDPAGALHWPAASLLAVSDLHLEKGSSYARHGQFLPPWDTHTTLDRLTLLLRRYRPRLVVALGDSFHDIDGSSRLPASELSRLRAMTERIVSSGSRATTIPHRRTASGANGSKSSPRDPGLPPPGQVDAQAEVSATTTPKRRYRRGRQREPPLLRQRARRLMMPAFGAYTGGLDVRDPAIARLFPRGGRVFLLGKERLFSFTLATLRSG